MTDNRITRLAEMLINHAVDLKRGENILIETTDTPAELAIELAKAVKNAGGNAFISETRASVKRAFILGATDECIELQAAHDLEFMKKMQAYIAVRGAYNVLELGDIPESKMLAYRKINDPVLNQRIEKTRWCVLRWPNASMAQSAGMSTEAFEDFYFKACLADYPAMQEAAKPLIKLMSETDKVRLVAKDTDITFSIKGIGAVPCCGKMNIPDGEVYSAPVRGSINGVIHYNTPTLYEGKRFENIRLTFKDGKIVDATSSDTTAMNAIFDTDPGAREVGEFSLGFNPYVTKPMCDILFDEKIAGSIHFTLGRCYTDAFNGNRSSVHWDLVLIMRPEYGGGEIWFDDRLIRKDGLFVVDELKHLNPDRLK